MTYPSSRATSSRLLIALGLLQQVSGGQVISYQLGGWAPPWGIEIRVDLLNAFVLLIVSAMAAWVFLYARRSVDAEIDPDKQTGFYAGLLLVYAGLAGITLTGDAFNAFVFLEISSLSSYAVISMGRDRRALTAAFQYLVMGTIGATFFLIGVGFLYMMTGTLNMADLAQRLRNALSRLIEGRPGLELTPVPLELVPVLVNLHRGQVHAQCYFITKLL